ncbi:MAG: (2Fe-2S)-binding protein [Saprospiraceae bacterium]|nr:(2Fe-2S)-binding protein [Saprospiraceae bacterium]
MTPSTESGSPPIINERTIVCQINGRTVTQPVQPLTSLLELLRDRLGLRGTKSACNEGECGACTVLVDYVAVNACLFLAVNAHGSNILTIEGMLQPGGGLDEVQRALVEHGAVQCGFCTSGMAMRIRALVNEQGAHPADPASGMRVLPSRADIQKQLEGNLCRCTGYIKIVDAVEALLQKKYGNPA